MKAVTLVALIGWFSVPAWADDGTLPMPRYNVDRACSANKTQVLVDECVNEEQAHYNELKGFGVRPDGHMFGWRITSEEVQRQCTNEIYNQIAAGGSASKNPYRYLSICIIQHEMAYENAHAKDEKHPKFEY